MPRSLERRFSPHPPDPSCEANNLGSLRARNFTGRQVDCATPQPVQKMTDNELFLFVVKQRKLTNKVMTRY